MQAVNPPLRTIRLYGKMGALFGRVHHFALDTNTPAEAVQALCSQVAGLREYLMGSKDRGVGFAVFAGKQNLSKDELKHPVGSEDIRIAPIILGSKNGGIFTIILGAIMVVVGMVLTAYGWGAIGVPLTNAGYAMVVGGVVQLLTPVPKGTKNKSVSNEPSYAFNGAVNTQAQGNPVPLLYGRMIVGSAVISAGINAEDYAPATSGIGTGAILGNSPLTGPYDSRRPPAIA